MKQKLLTLFTLLLTICSGAWADNENLKADDASGNSYTGTSYDFTATGTITTDKSQATAADDNTLKFNKGWLPSGSSTSSSNYYTFTAKKDISSLKVYYTMSDSKFGSKDQSKSGNFTYKIGDADPVVSTNTDDKSNKTAYVETISNIKKGDVIKLYSSASRLVIFGVYATYTSKTIATQAYAGVKKGATTLTVGTDFTKSEDIITLVESYKTTTAPTDVKLINHITYTDESTKDEDVDVTFDATASEGYFVGTATIASTEYTVRVPVDDTPSLEADKDAVTVTSAKVKTGTATIHLSGVNLAGENVTLALASAVDGLSIDKTSIAISEGAVDTDVKVSYQSNEDVASTNVNLTISTTGVSDIVIPITYSSTAGVTELETISAATTWDWSDCGQSSNVDEIDRKNFVVFANVDGWDAEKFNANAISGKVSYFYYNKSDVKYTQGNALKIKTSVPGVITVDFNCTGKKDDYRWLAVNGVVTDYKSKTEDKVTTNQIYVPAGEVLIEAIQGTSSESTKPDYVAANTMFNFRKVIFTPADAITVTTAGLATYASDYNLDFSGVTGIKAYKASISGKTITFTKMDEVPAGEGMLIRAMSDLDETTTFYVPHKASASPIENAMKRGEGTAVAYHPSDDIYNYVLSGGSNGVGFYQANGETVPKDRAYLQSTAALAKGFVINYDDEEGEETDGINAVSTKVENGVRYNLAGQKVGADYKGIVIVNGKKIVRK